jgi:hypothetical protein
MPTRQYTPAELKALWAFDRAECEALEARVRAEEAHEHFDAVCRAESGTRRRRAHLRVVMADEHQQSA